MLALSCGGSKLPAQGPASAPDGKAAAIAADKAASPAPGGTLITMISPSLLLPDLTSERGMLSALAAERQVLLDHMRLIVHEDGTMERAVELLPAGQVSSMPLPARLGGGYLFHTTGSSGTQLWRAASWLGKLDPIVQFSSPVSEVIAGFDRLYIRLAQNQKLIAIDLPTGTQMPLSPLPPSSLYGVLAFADGWRAVVDTDLRGPLVTFDAGTTWRPLGIKERPSAIIVLDGNPAMIVPGGQYVVDARGTVTFRPSTPADAGEDFEEGSVSPRPAGPFGRRPLRAAIEDGWPDTPASAVVARSGALARVSLQNGAVLQMAEHAFAERQASCHAVRLGAGFGFVCGEREGPTVVYAFAPPFSMREVLRFAKPRFVAASGNGALVIRGGCSDQTPLVGDTRPYCIRSASGALREIRVRGDLGVERVVALSDERVAVLVPPRAGGTGQVTLLKGSSMTNVPLVLPTKPTAVAAEIRRGMWLDGMEERQPGVLSGWVEAGGPILGVRVTLDGKVTTGELHENEAGTVIAGRFALSIGDDGRGAETTDGGMTWRNFQLPEREADPTDSRTRACGPAGCALRGWIRVGWGKPATGQDFTVAAQPGDLYTPIRLTSPAALDCELSSAAIVPLPIDKPTKPPSAAKPPPPPPRGAHPRRPTVQIRPVRPAPVAPVPPQFPWHPFRHVPAPSLLPDEIGIDGGVAYDIVSLRTYAWGKKGADWSRVGRWLIRFDDRFDPGGVRSSATGTPPWPDELIAADAVGAGSHGVAIWGAFLDSSGRAVLAHACKGSACSLYAVSEAQPVLPLRDASGRPALFFRPLASGAIRLGETWLFLTPSTSYDILDLWRADLGTVRKLSTLNRPSQSRYVTLESPRLVRRALGGGAGVLFSTPPDPGERAGKYFVLPIELDTGALGEPIELGRKDLGGVIPPRCEPAEDGWQLDVGLDTTPLVQVANGSLQLDSFELRLRLDPGAACVQAMAARLEQELVKPGEAPKISHIEGDGIPLAVTERGSGKRWGFQCRKR